MKKHLFKNTEKAIGLIIYSNTFKGNREEIINGVNDIDLLKDMRPTAIKYYITNEDYNDKERFCDIETRIFYTKDSTSFVGCVQSILKNNLNKIFDNTDDLDLFTITCTFNSVAYEGMRSFNHRNGKVNAMLSILEPTSHKTFHIIRKYNIELSFSEVIEI